MLRARAALLFSASSAWLGAQMLTLGVVRLQCGDDAGSAWWPALPLTLTLTLTLTLFLTLTLALTLTLTLTPTRWAALQFSAAGGGSAALQPEALPPQCTPAFLRAACAGSLCAAPLIYPSISMYLDVSRCISLYLPLSPCAPDRCAPTKPNPNPPTAHQA